jgi:hypothetical protein
MKILILPIAILLNLITCFARADDVAVGRFQLVQAIVSHIDEKSGTSSQAKELFKIDTATGQVWSYFSMVTKDGKGSDRWVPMEK